MKTKALLALPLISAALILSGCGSNGGSATRDSIRAVGSSTVYPFAKAVAESLARSNHDIKSPIIESTGTGGGVKLFCAGVGAATPDITNASRRMKKSEFESCQANGVTDIIEIQVGLDGIAFAADKGGIEMNLTPEIVYKALAAKPFGKEQAAKTWKDVDPSLPADPILVYGPPSTSGTRDALKELILEKGCETDPAMKALKDSDEDKFKQICTEVRGDGAYVDQGEQDNLIVQKIESNPRAIGVFGYSYLEENADKLNGLKVNGVVPTYDNISSFAYPGARPLYIYVKKAHLDAIPGLKQFLAEWVKNWGKDGPLAKIGLVVSPADVLAKSTKAATEYTVLSASDFE
ncbi:substrate-binding domain-containing protein [Altererythrobacter sp. CC-YST694]|uniref:substrate-binding domain-containing protein n=1 Tax=Altererythrobacter sp. CC-YST694 TaxID=2755038 RepID=UPI001D03529F|nr:substrate-binding domain-containing protein [Altererythrobacter sp. CC-YST694]MCB5424365.1 substrate-binding domain-containing protein [Altererythrobacter sp. CC-YST694]